MLARRSPHCLDKDLKDSFGAGRSLMLGHALESKESNGTFSMSQSANQILGVSSLGMKLYKPDNSNYFPKAFLESYLQFFVY
jgi:hypothetical protein